MGAFTPFRQFVLKVHSRCDLACDHCYVYQHADQSWRGRPLTIATETVKWTTLRIAEHARSHALERVSVVLHGGEPLLAGPEGLAMVASTLRQGLDGVCDLDLRIHTNGILLNSGFCQVFRDFDVKVGISLDGDRASNDRHRRYASGRGSYSQVIRAVDTVRREIPELYSGLLCTIDVSNDPISVYSELIRHRPPAIDFLLPHATWDAPPYRTAETAYANWLIAIFDRWRADGMPVPIRMFDSVIATTYGGASLTESLGLEPADLVVIETDGAVEQADSLKTAYHGAPDTGFNVRSSSLDALAGHPGIVARQVGLEGLAEKCRECRVVSSCGGGLYAHRYRTGAGFANPSVYCADLMKLIDHVRSRTEYPLHVLASGSLDALASGYGGSEALKALAEGQQTVGRALLAAVPVNRSTEAAWSVLNQVDEADRHALDRVLAVPFVRVWAAQLLRGGAQPEYLAAVAAASALRAGLDVALALPVHAGTVHLPGGGSWLVDKSLDTVRIDITDGRLELAVPSTELPARVLSAGVKTVVLDDLDPFRDCYGWPAASRLDEADLAAWQREFGEAWTLIEREYPDYATGLQAGLTTIVPLAASGGGRHVSATARHAFGAIAIARPADAAALALLLIHEYQHVKLGAILDLYDLYDPVDTRGYYAPWRPDPRPLEGLLQGIYAHIAVADYWRGRYSALARADANDTAIIAAAASFVRWRDQSLDAIETLMASGSLTRLGRRFAGGMRATLTGWRDTAVPGAAREIAARTAAEHHDAWLKARHANR